MNTNTTNTAKSRPDFEQVKRNYETALASGKDSTQELTDLATAVAYSVLNKCIDPQRKTAADRETVSDNGYKGHSRRPCNAGQLAHGNEQGNPHGVQRRR